MAMIILFLTACAPTPEQIASPVALTVAAIPTQTSFPTYTPNPTATPYPTYTPPATQTPNVIIVTATASPTPQFTPTETIPPTITPTTTITAMPSPTEDRALRMSLTEFVAKYDNLTDLQKEDFVASVPGKTVDWTGRVLEVNDDGEIIIDIPNTIFSSVSVTGLSMEDAKIIQKDSSIRFKGVIVDMIDLLGLHIYIIDAQLVK